MRPGEGRFWNLQWAALLLVAVLAVYWPALGGAFLWDDLPAIADNPYLRSWEGLKAIWLGIAAIPNESHYWPVLYTIYWVQYQIWGAAPLGYHVSNLVLHTGCGLVLVAIARWMRLPGACLAAFVFCLHPVQVESVAWIHSSKNLLSGVLGGLGVLACLHGRDCTGKRFAGMVALGCVLLALAMLAKSSAVVFPAAFALAILVREHRLTPRDWAVIGGAAVVVAGLAWMDFVYSRGKEQADFGLDRVERAALITGNLAHYLKTAVFPFPLLTAYPKPDLTWDAGMFGRLAVLLALAVLVVWQAMVRRSWGIAALGAWFMLAHLPTVGVVDFGFMKHSTVADRYQYLPMASVALAVGGAFSALRRQPWARGWWPEGVAYMFVLALGAMSWWQAGLYRDNGTLFRWTYKWNPDSALAAAQLGADALQAGEVERAEVLLARSVGLDSENAAAWSNLGLIAVQRGDWETAISHYRGALKLEPSWMKIANDLAWLLANKPEASGTELSEALVLAKRANDWAQSQDENVLDTLAECELANGNVAAAKDAWRRASRLAALRGNDQMERAIDARLAELSD